jgi:hypothetical protein
LQPLRRQKLDAQQDWLSEFAQEENLWVEVAHPPLVPPPHTNFQRFSVVHWVKTHRLMAGIIGLGLAMISAQLVVTMFTPRVVPFDPAQLPVAVTVPNDLPYGHPLATSQPDPPAVFTSQATTPGDSATSDREVSPRAASALPSRTTGPPLTFAIKQAPERTTAPSPTPRRAAPPLPAEPRPANVPPPPAVADPPAPTVVTTRPPVDGGALILSAPVRELAASAIPAPKPLPPPPPPEVRETAAVESVLERYRVAFSTLNSGVSDFWPGVDSRALDKAFSDLEEQSFEFDKCRVQLADSHADATCTGRATFVPKVGNKAPRTQQRQWSFHLVRAANRWIIDTVRVR